MRELLIGVEPCLEKRQRDKMLQHINELRLTLKRRTNMCFPDLLATFKYHDKNLTGSIPLDTVYSVCEELRINIDKSLIQVMLVTLGLINKNNFVDYTTFTQLLNWRHNFPPISKINDIPTKYLNYESSYTSACNDRKSIDNSKDAPWGVSSMSRNLSHSTRGLKSDLENLGNETNVMALINPSIYEQYGINHRHFFMNNLQDWKTTSRPKSKRRLETSRRAPTSRGSERTGRIGTD
uniref:EF-hand domain-containing protein n=1 Tax=Timema bartmani TaxID=61472 RepID=A0A7R9I302_9NEOP|nr:unnamed protein product [Timema bartmani]